LQIYVFSTTFQLFSLFFAPLYCNNVAAWYFFVVITFLNHSKVRKFHFHFEILEFEKKKNFFEKVFFCAIWLAVFFENWVSAVQRQKKKKKNDC